MVAPGDPVMYPDEASAPVRVTPTRSKNRPARPIDITLKSEPHGALAAVDGRPIGTTPTYWAGEADGLEHEFTFTLRGHASARYRFVPVTSGVLHVRLTPVAETPDGGLEPLIAPSFAPDAAGLPPDAAPVAPPPVAPPPAAPPPATPPSVAPPASAPPASAPPASVPPASASRASAPPASAPPAVAPPPAAAPPPAPAGSGNPGPLP